MSQAPQPPSLLKTPNYRRLALLLFICAIFLRVLLCWANPPQNSFDNHFEPISLIIDNGAIPAKDACLQCFHPPVFYWLSALAGKLALASGAEFSTILKFLQFIGCFYGILTVAIIYLILQKFPLSAFAKLVAFGTVCFLPRHIYMSAIHSNDTISYLFVALSIYLLIIATERRFSALSLIPLSLVITVTLFTKYTSLVIIPVVLTVFSVTFLRRLIPDWKKTALAALLVLLIPLSFLSAYALSNLKHYDSPLPWNLTLLDPSITQPRDVAPISFISFKPWEFLSTPILTPGKLHSFWTLIYGGMWFDTEPKFLYFLDANTVWWDQYYNWLVRKGPFPEDRPAISAITRYEGSALITLGLFPLAFVILGGYSYLRGRGPLPTPSDAALAAKMAIFPPLLLSNVAGLVALTVKLPVYSAMKASYFLNSLPALAVFLGLGVMSVEKRPSFKLLTALIFGALFFLVFCHIVHISYFAWKNGPQLFS
jgi:hypothetical protein